nr:MIT C-terminal domain-containing protein [Halochromatium roseum]
MRIDSTYAAVAFHYSDAQGTEKVVTTLEEVEYPHHYHRTIAEAEPDVAGRPALAEQGAAASQNTQDAAGGTDDAAGPKEGHLTFIENQKGVTYDTLFGPYVRGASRITVTDPYIRLFYQVRNFMEFVETVVRQKEPGEEVSIRLVTVEDDFRGEQQRDNLGKIKEACEAIDINFDWEFDQSKSIHARHIVTDTGWKIALDRGLDIFQHYEMNEAFAFANRLQQLRPCKAFEVTYLRQK